MMSCNRSPLPLKQQEALYSEANASLLHTREHGWKDVKVAHLFKACDCLHSEGKPGVVTHLLYLSQMGGYKSFTQKMEPSLKHIPYGRSR